MRAGCIVVLQALVLAGGLLAAEDESGPYPEVTKNFKVRWSSVRYDKAVVVENPEIEETAGPNAETLTLFCRVEVSDPNLVLGIGQGGVATRLTGRRGRNAAVNAMPVAPSRQVYERLRYRPKFSPPPAVPKWREIIRKILRQQPASFGPPQMVRELQPSQITVQLDMGLLDQADGELRSVNGSFYAVVAQSIEYVEVPFEPNNTWVRLTPDTEIRVAEATQAGTSFQYDIKVMTQGGRSMPPVMQGVRPTRAVTIGDSLPARMVVAQEFIGEDGKLLGPTGAIGPLIPRVGGRGTNVGPSGRVKTIRFVIAVNAAEYRIPFELERIPLPKP